MVRLRAGIVLSSDERMTMHTLLDSPPTSARSRTLLGTAMALFVSLAIAVGITTPAAAATGAVTGEWDVVAASNAQTPKLKSYNHIAEAWDTVAASNASFAVGAGKVIDGNEEATTPVSGGGFRFRNTASTAKAPTFTMTLPAGTGLRISSVERPFTAVNSAPTSSARTVSFSLPTVAAGGEYHEHFTWTFTTSASAVNIPVQVSVPGTGGFTATSTYRFTF